MGQPIKQPFESNPLPKGSTLHSDVSDITVNWTSKRLKKITRLRLLSDPGFPMYDVSYCYGELHDGTLVRVALPFSQLPKGKGKINAAIIKYAKRDKVYAKSLGIFSAISILN